MIHRPPIKPEYLCAATRTGSSQERVRWWPSATLTISGVMLVEAGTG